MEYLINWWKILFYFKKIELCLKILKRYKVDELLLSPISFSDYVIVKLSPFIFKDHPPFSFSFLCIANIRKKNGQDGTADAAATEGTSKRKMQSVMALLWPLIIFFFNDVKGGED